MRGVKSEATRRREVLESQGKTVASKPKLTDPKKLATKRKVSVLGHAARGLIPKEAIEPLHRAIDRPLILAEQQKKKETKIVENFLKNQDDPIGRARQILREVMPDMAKRLASIVRGQEKGWGPREQLQAMKLSAEIVGAMDKSGGLGGEDAPLSQQTVGTLRQVIAAGEARIAELQAQLDGLAVDGEAVQVEEEGGTLD